jgi:2-polyprenyl-3-methyl-5-hydroxy-6-metoxy-1,4-benzoquinol methylase
LPDEHWDAYVGSPPPWDIGRPQPAFRQVADEGWPAGNVLDVGCGTGEHALLASSLGHRATGVDLAPTAVELARAKAAERQLDVRFVLGSVFELEVLADQYDTVLDSGLFHALDDGEQAKFITSLAAVMRPGARYFMLAFSDRINRPTLPRQQNPAGIRAAFTGDWQVEDIADSMVETRKGEPFPALLSRIRKT